MNVKIRMIERMVTRNGTPAVEAPVGVHVYRIRNMRNSSAKFGPCEVCGQHCAEVHFQIEGVIYQPGSMTYKDCHDWFGHEDCLIQERI